MPRLRKTNDNRRIICNENGELKGVQMLQRHTNLGVIIMVLLGLQQRKRIYTG